METFEFKKGISDDLALIAFNVFSEYFSMMKHKFSGYKFEIDYENGACEVLKSLYGGVIVEHFNDIEMGTIGKYFAVRNVKTGVETLLCCPCAFDDGYRKEGRHSIDEPLRGSGWRAKYLEAIRNTDWHKMQPEQFAIMQAQSLTQVNNMSDLCIQYEDRTPWPKYQMVWIEGITEMTDEEVVTYDFMNETPDGHKGGTAMIDELNGVEFCYPKDPHLYNRGADSVWLIRSKNYCIAINCEGYSYSKYCAVPIGMYERLLKYIETNEKEKADYERYKSYRDNED